MSDFDALVIRTCSADMTSHSGFRWPESGPVSAPDWSPEPVCGQGLHGLIDGVGDYSLLSKAPDAKWLIVRVKRADSGHAAATGNSGHAAATGYSGHAAATGDYGAAAVLGYDGRAKAGKDGVIAVAWSDGKRPRLAVGYVGEDGIEADTWYRATKAGKLVKAK